MSAEDAFYLLVKTHPPYWHPSGLFQYVCVAANEALRFSCVVSFEAAHFFIIRREREKDMGYFIGTILWGIVWGFATRAIILNKGYEYEGTKWFWLGFFFAFIAVIVAATKPEYRYTDPKTVYTPQYTQKTQQERDKEILAEGGWRCDCGRVNYKYVSSCWCGKSQREVLAKRAKATEESKSSQQPIVKSSAQEIKEYKELLDSGIITQEEFDAKKKQLLGL